MHKFPDIPIVEIGPGSQPEDQDGRLEYMPMPTSMETYHNPILPEPEDIKHLNPGKRALRAILQALDDWHPGRAVQAIELSQLDEENLDFINQALGEGEVSVAFEGPSPIRAQESVLAGVWRVQHFDAHEQLLRDTIEVGEVPDMVSNATFSNADRRLSGEVDPSDPALQNAPALLVELADKIRDHRPGDPAHTINLTLLPLTEGDVMLLGESLGVGPVTILSRGYGNCRIGSTAKRNAWWIKYFNSQDVLILNTIEIVEVPSVACAAAEDLADSRERLDEILELYR